MTESEKEQIKNVPIVDVIGAFIDLKKSGSDYKACCPFHDEKTPSFVVKQNARDNFYKCFGCGAGGDSIKFVMDLKGLDFVQACETVASIGNITLTKEEKPFAKEKTTMKAQSPTKPQIEKEPIQATKSVKDMQTYAKPKITQQACSQSVLDYFKARGISEKTLNLAKVTQSTKFFAQLGKEDISINFNYYRNHELINVKHRSIEAKTFGLEKDCELILWNLDNIVLNKNGQTNIIITEGEIDALSLIETFGTAKNILSVPNGASSGKNQNLSYLDCEVTKKALFGKKLVLAFDSDNAGKNLKDAFLKRFGQENCFVLDYPSDCKDLNDVLVKYGQDAIKNIIEYKRYDKVNGITDVSDFENVIDNYYQNGYPNVDRIGIESIDNLIGFRGGELTMVTGISGSGKSEFLDFVMVELSKKHGWNFGVCSMETPNSLHFIKLAEKYINKPFRDIANQYGELIAPAMSVEELEQAKFFVYKHFNFISASIEELADGTRERGALTIDYILQQAKKLKAMYGIKGLVIDPWNTIDHLALEKGETETNYVSRILSKIIAFAEDFDIHIFLVAHPVKSVVDRPATLSDISGSGNFFNKTHNGISVFREKDKAKNPDNLVEVHVQKIKFKFVGRIGVANLEYNNITGNYKNAKTQITVDF